MPTHMCAPPTPRWGPLLIPARPILLVHCPRSRDPIPFPTSPQPGMAAPPSDTEPCPLCPEGAFTGHLLEVRGWRSELRPLTPEISSFLGVCAFLWWQPFVTAPRRLGSYRTQGALSLSGSSHFKGAPGQEAGSEWATVWKMEEPWGHQKVATASHQAAPLCGSSSGSALAVALAQGVGGWGARAVASHSLPQPPPAYGPGKRWPAAWAPGVQE